MIKLKELDILKASDILGVEPAVLKAVSDVEAPFGGFHASGEPRILFERHKFHAFTNGKFSESNPGVSNSKPGGYLGGVKEHDRLREAVGLNRIEALKSASWGKYQIMGFNYKLAGFTVIQDFINAMYKSEAFQLMAFINFIKNTGLKKPLQDKDWVAFAKGYNGRNYAKNNYDVKIQKAYEKHSRL
jgi:L-rhamnose isomerase